MRSPALETLDVLVGEWSLTLTDAWFLESRDVRQHGEAAVRWIGDGFIELKAEMEGQPVWHFMFGHSDAVALRGHRRRSRRSCAQGRSAGQGWQGRDGPRGRWRLDTSVGGTDPSVALRRRLPPDAVLCDPRCGVSNCRRHPGGGHGAAFRGAATVDRGVAGCGRGMHGWFQRTDQRCLARGSLGLAWAAVGFVLWRWRSDEITVTPSLPMRA